MNTVPRRWLSEAVAVGFPPEVLIPLAPPTATTDFIDLKDLGKTPATFGADGFWHPVKWGQGVADADWARGCDAGANVGLRMGTACDHGQFVFVDVDPVVDDEDGPLTAQAEAFSQDVALLLETITGQPLWVRQSRKGRAGILFRLPVGADPGRKTVTTYSRGGESLGKIEILTAGQQAAIGGVHVSGREMFWYRSDTGVKESFPDVATVPVLSTFEHVVAAVDFVTASLAGSGVTGARSKVRTAVQGTEGLTAPSGGVDDLCRLLETLPHDVRVSRDQGFPNWIGICVAAVGAALALGLQPGSEDWNRVRGAVTNWSCKWTGPAGETTTWTEQAEKWDTDWSQRLPQSSWPQLVAAASALGDDSWRLNEAGADFIAAGIKPVAMPAAMAEAIARRAAVSWPAGFRMSSRGLFYCPPGDADTLPSEVCGPFEVLAETRDEGSENWGLLLRWADADGRAHEWSMPRALVHAEGGAIAAQLEALGLSCIPGRTAQGHLKRALQGVRVDSRISCVTRPGWHTTATGHAYLLPSGGVFGASDQPLVMQRQVAADSKAYTTAGTLQEWQERVARYAVGNSRLALFISASLAGALLDIVGDSSGGFHLQGDSQSGKSTAAFVASSIWGQGDADGHVKHWRTTANGLEGIAAEHCDNALVLDEIGQATGAEVGDVVYSVCNGAGKARATRTGEARRSKTWRVMLLSTGEISLAAKMATANQRAMPGQEVRLVALPADAGAGLGAFEAIHDMASPAALADHLRRTVRVVYGTAGGAFLGRLAAERNRDPAGLVATIRAAREAFALKHLPTGAGGQVRSIVMRFALAAAAGELAAEWGVLPWPEEEATRAAAKCFAAFLRERGSVGAGEDEAAISQVRAFLEAHGESRFTRLHPGMSGADEVALSGVRTVSRAGFVREIAPGQLEYLVFPEAWKSDVCKGLAHKRVAATLQRAGYLRHEDGRMTVKHRLPTGQSRVYAVTSTILGDPLRDDA